MSYALLSVTDKTGIAPFAKELVSLGFKILSTGGTAKALEEAGIEITRVSDYTGSPEILGGRVKTLHPKIHASILCDHSDSKHSKVLANMQAGAISLVACNLYDFSKAAKAGQTLDEAMESIDIGGPTMLRASAKNFRHCLSIIDPSDYSKVLEFLGKGSKPGSDAWADHAKTYSAKVFGAVALYDQSIASYFAGSTPKTSVNVNSIKIKLCDSQPLRYGENPAQEAAFFPLTSQATFTPLQGKALSYNNLLDVDAAAQIASEFGGPSDPDKNLCVAIVKHNNPCGAAVQTSSGESLLEVFKRAYACDPISSFGGIVAINGVLDVEVARFIRQEKLFVECIVAESFDKDALDELSVRKNLRLLPWSQVRANSSPALGSEIRSLHSGFLVQGWDSYGSPKLEKVTATAPSDREMQDLVFAAKIAKCTKSNTLIYAKNGATIAIGAGQMSRIDCVGLAEQKLKNSNKKNTHLTKPLSFEGAVLASDAFFPFPDVAEESAALGVKAIIQPGGSKNDQLSVEACDRLGVSMVVSGQRHFRH